LVSFVLILYVLFVVFEFSGKYDLSFYFDSLIIPAITLIYLLFVKKKNTYFLLFLVFYTIGDLFFLLIDFLPVEDTFMVKNMDYYVGNSIFIIAYLFLFFKIIKSVCFFHIIKNHKIHLLVLTVLNIYLIYVLQVIVKPNVLLSMGYYFELIYNIVTLLLLTVALLNYFYRDNKKALYLFLGVLCLVFSEVIDIAFIYIAQRSVLSIIATSLSLVAFLFLFEQSKLLNKSREEENYMAVE
tara:strand:+ start:269 stop:988 length:720 start_codon:yes stop_codon:yes gene_type:complete